MRMWFEQQRSRESKKKKKKKKIQRLIVIKSLSFSLSLTEVGAGENARCGVHGECACVSGGTPVKFRTHIRRSKQQRSCYTFFLLDPCPALCSLWRVHCSHQV